MSARIIASPAVDADLIAACAAYQACRTERLVAHAGHDDAQQDEACALERQAFNAVAASPPALTEAGRAAKAAVAFAITERHINPDGSGMDDDLHFARRVLSEVAAVAEPDFVLLAACAEYHRLHAIFIQPDGDDDTTGARSHVRQTAFERVVNLSPQTPLGLRAKAGVALSALLAEATEFMPDPDEVWRQSVHNRPEEILAIDVLRGFVGSVAA